MTIESGSEHHVGGPYFDELEVGEVFDWAPALTLTNGLAAAHQAILGDRMMLPLNHHLASVVTGEDAPLAYPGLVCDIAIGQSTLPTHHVKANLYYRGLQFHRFPHIGDTLYTRTEIVGLRDNSLKPDRQPTGLAALRVTTRDQRDRIVLDFYRCAMLPLSAHPASNRAIRNDDVSSIGPTEAPTYRIPDQWDLDAYRQQVKSRALGRDEVGAVYVSSGDVVSSAPELARLTLNIAATHHDERVGRTGRLVYGGHTIGIALSQATRVLPSMVTVLGWESCVHLGPVKEGDTLVSKLHVERAIDIGSATALDLRSTVYRNNVAGDAPVLDWRFTALMA